MESIKSNIAGKMDREDDFHSEEEKPHMRPQFIYIDEQHEWRQEGDFTGGEHDYIHSFEKLRKGKYPLALRITTFVVSFWCLFAAILVFLIFLMGVVLGVVTLFRVEGINMRIRYLWNGVAKLLVFGCGLFVASFNPPYGIGLVLLYFMMKGQELNARLRDQLSRLQGMGK